MPRETENYRKHLHRRTDAITKSLDAVLKRLASSAMKPAERKNHAAQLAASLQQLSSVLNDLERLDASVIGRITELKDELARLKKEKIKVDEAFIQNTRDGMMLTDGAGKIVFANRSATELLGEKSIDEFIGKPVSKVLKLEDEHGAAVSRQDNPLYSALGTGKKVTVSVQDNVYVVRSDRTRFPVMMNVSPTRVGGKTSGMTILFHEIKKRSDRMRTDFISIASHQLRTPLTVSNLQVDMLLAGHGGELAAEQREFVEEIRFYNQKMAQILNEFLTVSRIERGTFVIDPKPTNVALVASDVLRELTPNAVTKDIDIIERSGKILPVVVTDPEFLRIIFHNLVSNAIKYTPAGGKVTVDIRSAPTGVIIKVSDTGYGIPKAEQEKVFTKLFRGREAEVREPNGMGLGLYITKSLLERCGGKIRFTSKEMAGTTFYVFLPLKVGKRFRKVPA
jgi:PAS domain S-box-containing protein